MTWVTATDLQRWADQRKAQGELPALVRKLIRRSLPEPSRLDFPAWELVARSGFDGVLESDHQTQYVPLGSSRWEMGTDKNPNAKAKRDFEKRSSQMSVHDMADQTFVFVTPRSWPGGKEWAINARKNFSWRDVLVFDANDLEHWLEICPHVSIWFARSIEKRIPGIRSLDEYWQALRMIGEHPLDPNVFVCDREQATERLDEWIASSPSAIFLKASDSFVGIDFVAAWNHLRSDSSQCEPLIVGTLDAWRDLAVSRDSFCLIPEPQVRLTLSDVSQAVEHGHHCLLSGIRSVGHPDSIELKPPSCADIARWLRASGYSDPQSRNQALQSGGSTTILKRLLSINPSRDFPKWSDEQEAIRLAPLALLGGWTHEQRWELDDDAKTRFRESNSLDVDVVCSLLDWDALELERAVLKWSRCEDPLFVRFGPSVFISSREDAWYFLAEFIPDSILQRFGDLATLLLDEVDPALFVPAKDRWLAPLLGKVRGISNELRTSIVETLALMTCCATAGQSNQKLSQKAAVVDKIIDQILPPGADWQRWASIGDNLVLLVEAAPEMFLARVESDLSSESPELPKLFQDRDHSLFVGAIHSPLLWALECLAWSPNYLRRVTVVLTKLASFDPGGTYANRPENSLCEILLACIWHTMAPVEERIESLRACCETDVSVGWTLTKRLFVDSGEEISAGTYLPRYRRWADGWNEGSNTREERRKYEIGIAKVAVEQMDLDAERWAEGLHGLLSTDASLARVAMARVTQLCESDLADLERYNLWVTVDKLADEKDEFQGFSVLIPKTHFEGFRRLSRKLKPRHPAFHHAQLFDYGAGYQGGQDYESWQRDLRRLRVTALNEILEYAGSDGIYLLCELAEDAASTGFLLGVEALIGWDDLDTSSIVGPVPEGDEKRAQLLYGFIQGGFAARRWVFVDQISDLNHWSAEMLARFATSLPRELDVWQWLNEQDPTASDHYWQIIRGIFANGGLKETKYAIEHLIAASRPLAAIRVLNQAVTGKVEISSEAALEYMEQTLAADSKDFPEELTGIKQDVWGIIGWLQQATDDLPQEERKDRRLRLAQLEWCYLSLRPGHGSAATPATLEEMMMLAPPDLFIRVLQVSTKISFNDEQADHQNSGAVERKLAGEMLLKQISCLPRQSDNGDVDTEELLTWIRDARSQAQELGLLPSCDCTLGEIFGRSILASNDTWFDWEIGRCVEAFATDDFLSGFQAVLYHPKMEFRGAHEGGERERTRARNFREVAERIHPNSIKLARAFEAVAEQLEKLAEREDESVKRDRFGR
ncbi:MAG: hypothetical protein AAGG48_26995 [Planctomycetota bacterium]